MNERMAAWSARCGFIAPVLFVVVVMVLAWRRPGYSHVEQFISELGETGASDAVIMNAMFVIHGIFISIFAWGLRSQFIVAGASIWTSIFITIYGASTAGAGVFRCDPGCPLPGETVSGTLHVILGLVAGAALAATSLCVLGTHKGTIWASYRRFTAACGVVMCVALCVLTSGMMTDDGYGGLVQRIFYVAAFAWLEVSALRLLTLPARFVMA